MGTFFLDVVNSTHTFATGGTSTSEFWYYMKDNPPFLIPKLKFHNVQKLTQLLNQE